MAVRELLDDIVVRLESPICSIHFELTDGEEHSPALRIEAHGQVHARYVPSVDMLLRLFVNV